MSTAPPIDPESFREILGHYPTGVALVTAIASDGEPAGMVVGSFTTVSLDPPLVAYLPAKTSSTYQRLRTSSSFCVNVLAADQENVCRVFARKTGDKFADVTWTPSPSGSPRIDGAVAWIDCTVETVTSAGDHYLVVGQVDALGVSDPRPPLVFFQGGYGQFSSSSFVMMSEAESIPVVRLAEHVRAHVEELAARLGVRCDTLAHVGNETVVVASAGAMGAGITTLGRRVPLAPPFGALFAAFGSDRTRMSWLEWSEPAMRPVHEQALSRVRTRGWSIALADHRYTHLTTMVQQFSTARARTPAIERQVRRDLGAMARNYDGPTPKPDRHYDVHHLAAPVLADDGTAVLVIRIEGLPNPMTGAQVSECVADLTAAAAEATATLGGHGLA